MVVLGVEDGMLKGYCAYTVLCCSGPLPLCNTADACHHALVAIEKVNDQAVNQIYAL